VYESTRARARDAITDLISALRTAQSDASKKTGAEADPTEAEERAEALRVIHSALECVDGASAAAAAVSGLQAAEQQLSAQSGGAAADSKSGGCKECVAVYGASVAEKGESFLSYVATCVVLCLFSLIPTFCCDICMV
jgi:hypothetical protein